MIRWQIIGLRIKIFLLKKEKALNQKILNYLNKLLEKVDELTVE